jgi:cytochrome c biogenesis protein CcdA
MSQLLIFITAIAILDSLNPTAISIQVILLSTRNAIPRTLAFILGVFLAYWVGGVAIALGLGQVISNFLSRFRWNDFADILYLVQFILGIILLTVAYRMKTTPYEPKSLDRNKSLTPFSAMGIGIIATASDLPTALPYLAAIERILKAQVDFSTLMGLLIFYNLVFILPLLILLGIYICLKSKAMKLMEKINWQFCRLAPKLIKGLLIIIGVFLIAESTRYGAELLMSRIYILN